MNSWMDEQLSEVDQEPESWADQLNNMFDGEIEVIDVNDGKELEGLNLF